METETEVGLMPSEVFKIFGGRVRFLLAGRVGKPLNGNFNLNLEVGQEKVLNQRAVPLLEKVRKTIGAEKLLALRPEFGPRIVVSGAGDIEIVHRPTSLKVFRTGYADGAMVGKIGTGVAICNADCHIGILYHPETKLWVMLHLGYACLLPENRGQMSTLKAAVVAFEKKDIPANELWAWFGAGARGCCYGFNPLDSNKDEKIQRIRREFPGYRETQVVNGPRRGEFAVDNLFICQTLARWYGIKHIEVDKTCTSCAGTNGPYDDSQGWWHSNLRDGMGKDKIPDRGRNCAAACLAK